MGNSLVQRLHHIALILVLSMSRQRFSVSRISTEADSVRTTTETQEPGTRSCQNNALKKNKFNNSPPLPPPPPKYRDHLLPSCSILQTRNY